ncbi:MAG: hypothetical protein WC843_00560 [Candidatus Gracilibacteria bacterium]|jgi:hypothetical protein
MATQSTIIKPFSIQNFQELFYSSKAMKYLSRMDIQQIEKAISEKNKTLLMRLYPVVIQEKYVNDKIIQDFIIKKNRLLNDFEAEGSGIYKKYSEKLIKNKQNKLEQKDLSEAENILKQI